MRFFPPLPPAAFPPFLPISPVDATHAGNEAAPEVTATIETLDGSQDPITLHQVHTDTTWQKRGQLADPDRLSFGVDPKKMTSTQFAINYATGEVTLGTTLTTGKRLTINYWPVQAAGNGFTDNLQQTVVATVEGDFIAQAAALAPPLVLAQNTLMYSKGQTLLDFLRTNVAHQHSFLTGTMADKHIEFTVDPKNNHPLQPRDPRYQFMTAQPYASSSYGFFQLTLLAFSRGSKQVQLNQVFNPGYSSAQSCPIAACAPITPIYQLLTQPQTNFDLAGKFHRLSYGTFGPRAFCDMTNSCNTALWQREWTQVMNFFNSDGNGYTGFISDIVKNGDNSFAPQNPNP